MPQMTHLELPNPIAIKQRIDEALEVLRGSDLPLMAT